MATPEHEQRQQERTPMEFQQSDKIRKLKQENQELTEALQEIVENGNKNGGGCAICGSFEIAQQALDGVGDKE